MDRYRFSANSLIPLAFAFVLTLTPAHANPLHDAVRSGDEAAVIEALESTENIDETDFFLGAPLHVAVTEQKPGIAQVLIDGGADVDAPSEIAGKTALHLAAEFGDPDMVALLLDAGADLHARDQSGKATIHLATMAGHAGIVQMLLAAGVEVDSREPGTQMTPLLMASLQGEVEIVKLLVDAGADIEAASDNGRTPFFYSASMESYVNIGNDALIRYFADLGVNTTPRDTSGQTPLEWANSRNVPAYAEIAEILGGLGIKQ